MDNVNVVCQMLISKDDPNSIYRSDNPVHPDLSCATPRGILGVGWVSIIPAADPVESAVAKIIDSPQTHDAPRQGIASASRELLFPRIKDLVFVIGTIKHALRRPVLPFVSAVHRVWAFSLPDRFFIVHDLGPQFWSLAL